MMLNLEHLTKEGRNKPGKTFRLDAISNVRSIITMVIALDKLKISYGISTK
jgi:hypothetical protein